MRSKRGLRPLSNFYPRFSGRGYPLQEAVLEINYRLGMNAKGFSNDTKYKLLDYFPKRTLRPPRPGNFTWVGRGAVSLCVGHRMNREMTEIGERVIVGIGG